jgi:hypothetical protein
MSDNGEWKFAGAVAEVEAFSIAGIDVWKSPWVDTKERVRVKDPLYQQDFTFHVYTISSGGKMVRFAAGEFSNGVYGFFTEASAVGAASL